MAGGHNMPAFFYVMILEKREWENAEIRRQEKYKQQ